MASLNKAMIIGNLGRDPEIRQAGDAPVADFSVAVSEKFKGRDGSTQEKTEWVNVVAWRRLAEVSRDYLRKGSQVYVEGKLSTRSWTDKTTGSKRYQTEVVADNIQMLGGRSGAQGGSSSPSYGSSSGYGSSSPSYGSSSGYGSSSPSYGSSSGYGSSSSTSTSNSSGAWGDDDLPF